MKNFILIFLLLSFGVYSQNYTPFSPASPKKFQNVLIANDSLHFFYPYDYSQNGDTTFFQQYGKISTNLVDVLNTSCDLWGGGMQPSFDTTWLGRKFNYNNLTKELILYNKLNDTITFNFNLALNDSALFYQNNSDKYYIKYTSLTPELVIDSMENIKTFKILHFDISNNIVNSTLNGFNIKLSENLGLVNFIDCINFPVNETQLQLIGQLNPNLGYYQLTYDELYPWEIGDSIQISGANPGNGVGTNIYKLITISNRVETIDSVWIYLNVDTQIINSPPGYTSYPAPYSISYPNPIVYAKGENISKYPNGMVDQFDYYHLIDTISTCYGVVRYKTYNEPLTYCDSCYCMTSFDAYLYYFNTVEYESTKGITNQYGYQFGSFNGPSSTVIYSNIGNLNCGNYIPLGVEKNKFDVKMSPNPTQNNISIESKEKIVQYKIFSLQGELILTRTINNSNFEVNLVHLPKGIYIIHLKSTLGKSSNQRIVKF